MSDVFTIRLAQGDPLHERRHLTLHDPALGQAFDRLCRLAADVLDAPIAVVAIFDGERQVLRGGVQNWQALGTVREFPLARTFCQHLLQSDEPLIVDDARRRPEMQHYLPVSDHGVVAYLGLPFALHDGSVLGSLCVMDSQPHAWTPRDVRRLRDLSASVVSEIDLRYQLHVQERIEHTLEERNALARQFLERFPVGSINVFDRDLRFVSIAGMGMQQAGISREELLGKRLIDLVPQADFEAFQPYYQQVLGGASVEFEFVRDNTTLAVSASPLSDSDGSISAIFAVVYDITERRRIETALRESEARFRTAFDDATGGISLADLDGRYVRANRAFCEMFGYSEAELDTMTFEILTHPDDRAATADNATRLLAGTIPNYQMEKRYLHKSGAVVWTLVSVSMLHDDDGNPSCFLAQLQNISERKLAEQALQESERRFRVLYEHSPDGIMLIDPHHPSGMLTIVDANPASCAMNGYSREELIGLPLSALTEPSMEPSGTENIEAYLARLRTVGKIQAEDEHWRQDGTTVPIEYAASLVTVNGRELILGIDRDITQRKQMEDSLRRSEARFRSIFEHAPIGIINIDAQARLIGMNRAFEALLGVRADETYGTSVVRLFHPDDVALTAERYRDLIAREQTLVLKGQRCIHADGHELWVHATASAVRDNDGAFQYAIVMVEDVTDHLRIEAALRESEERFRSANEYAATGMALVGLDGRFLLVNPALCATLGYDRQALLHMRYQDVTHPEDRHLDADAIHQLLVARAVSYQFEKRYLNSAGTTIWVQLNISLMRDEAGEPSYFITQFQDITERKRTEQELALVRRRLGESSERERLHLARELHDGAVQQLLGISYQLVARSHHDTNGATHAHAVAAHHTLNIDGVRRQILDVVSQLRALTRELRPAGLEEFGLSAALEHYILQLRTEYDGSLPQFVTELVPDECELAPSIAVCLFRVAQEAIRNTLTHAAAECITVALRLDDDVVRLSIQDDGRGFTVPARLSQLVHDDHFGLVGMRERVEAVDGDLQIDTYPGSGTTIRVTVPRQVRAA